MTTLTTTLTTADIANELDLTENDVLRLNAIGRLNGTAQIDKTGKITWRFLRSEFEKFVAKGLQDTSIDVAPQSKFLDGKDLNLERRVDSTLITEVDAATTEAQLIVLLNAAAKVGYARTIPLSNVETVVASVTALPPSALTYLDENPRNFMGKTSADSNRKDYLKSRLVANLSRDLEVGKIGGEAALSLLYRSPSDYQAWMSQAKENVLDETIIRSVRRTVMIPGKTETNGGTRTQIDNEVGFAVSYRIPANLIYTPMEVTKEIETSFAIGGRLLHAAKGRKPVKPATTATIGTGAIGSPVGQSSGLRLKTLGSRQFDKSK